MYNRHSSATRKVFTVLSIISKPTRALNKGTSALQGAVVQGSGVSRNKGKLHSYRAPVQLRTAWKEI
jgi:hypothetical protein